MKSLREQHLSMITAVTDGEDQGKVRIIYFGRDVGLEEQSQDLRQDVM